MTRDPRPFDQLSEEDQKSATDIVVSLTTLLVRLPAIGQPLYDYIITEFAHTHSLPSNVVKYAMRDIGQSLMNHNWDFSVTKRAREITTIFKMHDGNGEVTPEEK